jgi:hypothetical protein
MKISLFFIHIVFFSIFPNFLQKLNLFPRYFSYFSYFSYQGRSINNCVNILRRVKQTGKAKERESKLNLKTGKLLKLANIPKSENILKYGQIPGFSEKSWVWGGKIRQDLRKGVARNKGEDRRSR